MARAVKDKPTTKRAPRTRRKASPVAVKKPKVAHADADTDTGVAISAHRLRQASVSDILDDTFGALAESNPELWERRAYLLLVGLVYERLATNEDEVSTDELVKLAKVLAENRRAEAKDRKNRTDDDGRSDSGDGDPESTSNGKLPPRFADSIRQVYGVNVSAQSPGDAENNAK